MKFINLFWIGDSSPAVVTQVTNTETQESEFKVTLYTLSKTLDFGGYETMPIFVQEIDSLRIFSSETGPQLLFQVKQETVDAFHPTRAYTLTAHVLEAYNSYIQMSHESD